MSFYISLSGLKGAQADLSGIANNVANVAATAFKKSRVDFGDIFAASPMQSTAQSGGQGVRLLGSSQQFTQGSLETTGKTLDVAITGEGFFTVKSAPPANQVSFTRNGAFSVDENRNVVDTLGNKVQVLPVDASGKLSSTNQSELFDLTIPLDNGKSVPTSPYAPGSARINDSTGTVTVAFENGTSLALAPAITIPTGNPDTPAANYSAGSAVIDLTSGIVTVSYDDGTDLALSPAVKLDPYYVDGSGVQQSLTSATVSDAGVITQTFADGHTIVHNESVVIPATNQTPSPYLWSHVDDTGAVTATFEDGSTKVIGNVNIPASDGGTPAPQLSSVGISVTGVVSATFADGSVQNLGMLALANFPSQEGLSQAGDGHWTVSRDSGKAFFGAGNNGQFGAIRSGSLERSNVDITEELVALIAAQRNFQANAKAMEAASTLTQTIVNMRS